jgi:hypothetical protein
MASGFVDDKPRSGKRRNEPVLVLPRHERVAIAPEDESRDVDAARRSSRDRGQLARVRLLPDVCRRLEAFSDERREMLVGD